MAKRFGFLLAVWGFCGLVATGCGRPEDEGSVGSANQATPIPGHDGCNTFCQPCPPHQFCSHLCELRGNCGLKKNDCVQYQLCIIGYHFDTKSCQCQPD